MLDNVREYWRIFLGLALIVVAGLYLVLNDNSNENEAMINKLSSEITEYENELAKEPKTLEDFEQEVEVIVDSGVTVKDMAGEILESQKVLADTYLTAEEIDFDARTDEDEKRIEDAQLVFTRLTGSTNFVDLWLLNPEWRLELDTVGSYSDVVNIPVVFSMYTSDDELAGIVRGIYNIDDDIIKDIERDYTQAGLDNRTDVGGM